MPHHELESANAPNTPYSSTSHESAEQIPVASLDDTPYVELHMHSNYSLLDGASSIHELVNAARELGYRALALSDHHGMYGSMEFARTAKEVGLHPITGLELEVVEENGSRSHLTLLAENQKGYANLCRLSSSAFGLHERGIQSKEDHRLDPRIDISELEHHTTGLIVLTGCREGRVPRLIQYGRHHEAEEELNRLIRWFGTENVFVELQDNYVFGDRPRNLALVELAERTGIGVVGTGNVHYHQRDRHQLQDVLVAIRHRKTLDECHSERRPNSEFYLRSPQEQAHRFATYHPQAADNSVLIARRCNFDLTEDLGYRLPSPPVPNGRTPHQELERICHERLTHKYISVNERSVAEKRLEEELQLLSKHNLAGFFLIYYEVFRLAKEVSEEIQGHRAAHNITELPPGRGRGSSVSSIICYLIGLSHIDPVRNNLFIGRFLNEEMHSLPDIDLDFPRDIRERLIERVYERWGHDHAALVATFPTYRLRSAIRDVGKALGFPNMELDRIAKLSHPYTDASELCEVLQRHPEYENRMETQSWSQLSNLAQQLSGFPRHLSQHVGGMVISSEPLIDYVPCQPAAWPGRYLCHWDKDSIADARMVKIDFLALGMLSVVEETVDLIAQQRGEIIDLSRIDFSDPAVYDDICRGDTVGVFQIESRAQVAMLPRTRPRNLDDLTVQVSIVRPGPIVGGAVNPYIKRREHKLRDTNYAPEMPHDCVRDVLTETLGVVIFQEQVLQVAQRMGGFTVGESERFRRAMSRKHSHQPMAEYRKRFLAGASERGVLLGTAESVFDNLMGFAEFGFPKSHGVAFGLLAYQSMWLKHYYTPEIFCALFNNQPMGFYPPHVLTNDAQRHKLDVRRPDINISNAICTVEDVTSGSEAIRIGLGYVKGVGKSSSDQIELERAHDGPFRSLFDFLQRTGLSHNSITNLIRIGAFDSFGLNQRELIWQLGLFSTRFSQTSLYQRKHHQLHLPLPTDQDQVKFKDFDSYQQMSADYELLSLSPDSHPMQFLRSSLGEGIASSRHLQTLSGGQTVESAGLVVCRQKPLTANGIIFLLLEDEFGMVNVLVNRELAERFHYEVYSAVFLRVQGTLDRRSGEQRTLVALDLHEVLPTEALRVPDGKSWG